MKGVKLEGDFVIWRNFSIGQVHKTSIYARSEYMFRYMPDPNKQCKIQNPDTISI